MISNSLTSLRIVLLIPFCALLLRGGSEARWWALGLFLAAGFTDVLDGFLARRLGEVSAFGAMLDLVADRLLTTVTLVTLVAVGALPGWGVAAAMTLIARDLIVASLNEALPGRLSIRTSVVERIKIAAYFLAAALLIAPEVWRPLTNVDQHELGVTILLLAALLSLGTLADYGRRALRAFALGA
jgi:CDP-diacylglycerol--glycerol-3-phosphate 3-phosphatidyltransferase/cardiolipin synthase